ncbi:uncharacterized protein [Venturia canescens]|uniref:uncharacterized protein n=1 Tax=Venturia canescens TaxID=32260 RepID=UPI001C9C1DEC|nr:uncharacterized protein LOC122408464 [Venturia canescens]
MSCPNTAEHEIILSDDEDGEENFYYEEAIDDQIEIHLPVVTVPINVKVSNSDDEYEPDEKKIKTMELSNLLTKSLEQGCGARGGTPTAAPGRAAVTALSAARRRVDYTDNRDDKIPVGELWCQQCDIPLSLRNIVKKYTIGLANELYIRCTVCNTVKIACTGKSKNHINRREYDVNLKLAVAILDAGIGEAQMNTILSALDIPAVTKSLLKRHERIVGVAIEELANESCRTSIRIEKDLTVAADVDPSSRISSSIPQKVVSLKASYDAEWQKRGTGHAYNSLTGHASLIGYHSGKVLSYATRTKRCAKCDRNHPKDDHDCRLNFDRSAKAMEPDMAIELITKNRLLLEENVSIAVMIGDDDASSIAAVRRESVHKIEKWSDINHAKKGLTSALYALKVPKEVINYFARAFSYAVYQNKGEAAAVRAALFNIIDHAYGNHDKCGDWCHSHAKENCGDDRLKGSKALTDPELRSKLTTVIAKYANNAEKLAPCGSSQANESFNRIVSSKHPKAQFYGASESMAYRVAAAVCQKNLGTMYVPEVFKKLDLAPGKNTTTYRRHKDAARLKKSDLSKTVQMKKKDCSPPVLEIIRMLSHNNEKE